jgi:hypothetical protein
MDSIYSLPGDSMYASLSKAAARFALSIVRSWQYLEEAYADSLLSLLSADTLWTLCLILAAWAIATIVGGPIALAIDGFLIAYGLYALYEQLATTWAGLRAWAQAAYNATSDEQINAAARAFATTVAAGSLDLLTVLLTHKVFVKAQATLSRRFPRPQWLDKEVVSAKEERARRKAAGPKEKESTPARTGESTQVREGARTAPATLRSLQEAAGSLGRAAGAAPSPSRDWTLPGILGGVLLLGAASAVAVASLGGNHGRKR